MNKFKTFLSKLLFIFFIIIIFIFISAKSYSNTMFKNISNSFLRLHIIANSDSTEDQMVKYKIRDAIIEYMSPYFDGVSSKDDALTILNNHINEIYNIALDVASSNGYYYPITVSVGNFYFPTREYDTITLPEGYYDALKIELGESKGQNWWCVMFPSLCILESSDSDFSDDSKKILQENLNSEEYSIISNEKKSVDLKIKFKLIELFENI
ncbi:MAG: stage II sporulation protein R [Clostridia bacterium]|nr:stage II sporulation protein R [Clostridia bacterium]